MLMKRILGAIAFERNCDFNERVVPLFSVEKQFTPILSFLAPAKSAGARNPLNLRSPHLHEEE